MKVIHKLTHSFIPSEIVGGLSKGTGVPFDYEWVIFDFLTKGPVGNPLTKELAKQKNFEVNNTPARFDGENLRVGEKTYRVGYCVLTKFVIFQLGKGRWSHQKPQRNLSEELIKFHYWIVCDVIRIASKNSRVVWYQIPSNLLHTAVETGLLTEQGWSRKRFFDAVRQWNKLGMA